MKGFDDMEREFLQMTSANVRLEEGIARALVQARNEGLSRAERAQVVEMLLRRFGYQARVLPGLGE